MRAFIDSDVINGLFNVADMFKASLLHIDALEKENADLKKKLERLNVKTKTTVPLFRPHEAR